MALQKRNILEEQRGPKNVPHQMYIVQMYVDQADQLQGSLLDPIFYLHLSTGSFPPTLKPNRIVPISNLAIQKHVTA